MLRWLAFLALAFLVPPLLPASADEPDPEGILEAEDVCLLNALREADDQTPVGALRRQCAEEIQTSRGGNGSLLTERRQREQVAGSMRSILTPHNRNYLLPATLSLDPNDEPFRQAYGAPASERLDRTEAKFQLSLKFALAENLFGREDSLFFGFTTKSFWQAYNTPFSSPFRETNYEPEIFWTNPLRTQVLGSDANVLTLGLSHQSNGLGGTLSRSWNRVYANFAWEKNNFVLTLKPWWRIPENAKGDPLDSGGDDNPDIEKYMGHFEFTTSWRSRDHELSLMLRNNLRSENRGAVQLDWTFPFLPGVRGHAQYFNGYGESLIDYNARIERFGIGILLSDLL